MKKLIVVALISLIGYTASAQAKISFNNETVDYGKIEKGSDGVRVFEFTNTGDAELVVTNVKSSCGCTVPKKPEAPIAPGEKGEIVVEYDTKNRKGPFRKTITVTTNVTENPIVALKIKGEVLPKS